MLLVREERLNLGERFFGTFEAASLRIPERGRFDIDPLASRILPVCVNFGASPEARKGIHDLLDVGRICDLALLDPRDPALIDTRHFGNECLRKVEVLANTSDNSRKASRGSVIINHAKGLRLSCCIYAAFFRRPQARFAHRFGGGCSREAAGASEHLVSIFRHASTFELGNPQGRCR